MLTIIGCGNPARGDDGVGSAVIARLAASTAHVGKAQLLDAGTAGMEVMYRLRHASRAVIIDACRSGGEPGAVYRLPAREAVTPMANGHGLHGMRWDHALFAAQKMYGDAFLDRIEVFLVEAQTLEFGLALSEPVARGADRVVQEVEALLAQA